eukprot:scaffold1708_cov322-Pavlova_lutheri.AAC.12
MQEHRVGNDRTLLHRQASTGVRHTIVVHLVTGDTCSRTVQSTCHPHEGHVVRIGRQGFTSIDVPFRFLKRRGCGWKMGDVVSWRMQRPRWMHAPAHPPRRMDGYGRHNRPKLITPCSQNHLIYQWIHPHQSQVSEAPLRAVTDLPRTVPAVVFRVRARPAPVPAPTAPHRG